MTTTGTVRALVVLVELDYGLDPDNQDPAPNGNTNWPVHSLPDWANNVDPALNCWILTNPVGTDPKA